MDIVLLAAGTSSRMGTTNKMLIPFNNTTMACQSALNALCFLEDYCKKTNESSKLIIVTGYRRPSLIKSLKEAFSFVERTEYPITLVCTNNPDFRKGQFSSTQTGVKEVTSPLFFISLADMPYIGRNEYYEVLKKYSSSFDVIRPFVEDKPGHPVLLTKKMAEQILKAGTDSSVSEVIKSCRVNNIQVSGKSYIKDFDTPSDLN